MMQMFAGISFYVFPRKPVFFREIRVPYLAES